MRGGLAMGADAWAFRTLLETAQGLARGDVSSVDLTTALLTRARSTDGAIKAFLRVTEELALEQARASDARRREGKAASVLDGIPIALKDLFVTRGVETT